MAYPTPGYATSGPGYPAPGGYPGGGYPAPGGGYAGGGYTGGPGYGAPPAAPVGVAYTGGPVTMSPVAMTGPSITTMPGGTVVTMGGMAYPPGTVVTVVNTGMAPLGHNSTATVCPNCRASITTSVTTTPGMFAWMAAGILCFVGCWPCCLIPFCVPNCQDAIHSCPNCRATIGVDAGRC